MLPTPPASPGPCFTCAPEDRINQIVGGHIQLIQVLGVGAYGVVYKALELDPRRRDTFYAVKALNKVGLEPRQQKFQTREIQLHSQVSAHSNIVSLYEIIESPDCTFVVLEYCPGGDLFSRITEQGFYLGQDLLARNAFLQILDSVEYCHRSGIYHRDLKPENILVAQDGISLKLADFGLATREQVTSDFGCGSTFYMSPECQQSNPQPGSCYASAPNDIWSLGVILVNLTCGRNPWKRASAEDSTFRAYMKDRSFLKSILPLSNDLDLILRRIFELNPAQRITLGELKQAILNCQSFTTTPQAPIAPSYGQMAAPSPPYSPVDAARDCAYSIPSHMHIPDVPPMAALPPASQDYRYASCANTLISPMQTPNASPRVRPQADSMWAPVSYRLVDACKPTRGYFKRPACANQVSTWHGPYASSLAMNGHSSLLSTGVY